MSVIARVRAAGHSCLLRRGLPRLVHGRAEQTARDRRPDKGRVQKSVTLVQPKHILRLVSHAHAHAHTLARECTCDWMTGSAWCSRSRFLAWCVFALLQLRAQSHRAIWRSAPNQGRITDKRHTRHNTAAMRPPPALRVSVLLSRGLLAAQLRGSAFAFLVTTFFPFDCKFIKFNYSFHM